MHNLKISFFKSRFNKNAEIWRCPPLPISVHNPLFENYSIFLYPTELYLICQSIRVLLREQKIFCACFCFAYLWFAYKIIWFKKEIFYSNFNMDKKNFRDLSSPTIYLTVLAGHIEVVFHILPYLNLELWNTTYKFDVCSASKIVLTLLIVTEIFVPIDLLFKFYQLFDYRTVNWKLRQNF